MRYKYPNGAFSVILDIPGNPFAQYGNSIGVNEMASRAMHLERTLEQAKKELSDQIETQKEVYKNINTYLKKINPMADLKNLLNPSNRPSQQKSLADEIAPTLEQYRTELNHLLFEYKSKYIAYFNQLNPDANGIDKEIQDLIQLTYSRIKDLKIKNQQELDKKIAKIHTVNQGIQTAYFDISIPNSSEIIINGNAISNSHANRIQLLANKIKTIIGENPNLKDFSRYNSLKNLTQVRKKNSDYASAFEAQQSLIQEAMKDYNLPYDVASKLITILLKKELNLSTSSRFQWNPYSETSISSASGDVFEFSANFDFQQRLTNIIKDNAQQLITAGVITEEVRFIAQTRKNKTKKSIKKFEQTKAALNSAHQELLNYFDDNLKLIPKKDKIDDYIILHNTENLSEAKYVLAFSDKLKYAADNINIISSSHEKKEEDISSTLLSSIDLLSSLTSSQEGFIFAALNSSPVSAFSGYASQFSSQIERILISLIYDLAYNPNNFTSYIQQLYSSLDFSNTQTLYLHRSGPKIIPSFEILESTLNMLIDMERNLTTAQPINVAMYYSPLSIDNLYNDEEYGKLATEQKTLQWENVARQVAESIKLQVIMNISPILFNMEKIHNTL